jgi:glycosyltransferase involved in cell wall biosynthesis
MKKTSLLFLTRYYLPVIGGIEQHIYKLSNELKKQCEIDILTFNGDSLIQRESINGIDVNRQGYFQMLRFKLRDYDVILVENFDIHFFFMICKLMVVKSLRISRAKLIFVPHGGYTLNWKFFALPQRTIKYAYNKTLGQIFIYHYVDRIVAGSLWEKNALRNEGVKNRITIIRNGIDKIDVSTIAKSKYFIFVGRIDPIKNIEEIIRAYDAIRNHLSYQDYSLLIVGNFHQNEQYYQKLRRLVQDLKLEKSIKFVGKIEEKKKMQLVAGAMCLFCLSYKENDPLVLKEAFSVGTKVVISMSMGLMDYQHEVNAFVYEPNLDFEKFESFVTEEFVPSFNIPLSTWADVAEEYGKII